MTKKQIIGIGSAIIFVSVVLFGIWFYSFRVPTVNYLIPGVPYYGIYNLFFQKASSDEISHILDVLGYWGDKRFTIRTLNQRFLLARTTASTTSDFRKSEIKNFFVENGYKTSGWLSVKPDSVIKKIKKYVNPKKKVPVIAIPNQVVDEKNNIFLLVPQVIIGVFDDSQKVIVHDPYYGNNYEISYKDFEEMFQSARTGIFAVWPSNEIKGQIEGPNHNIAYPQRAESMDKAGALLATKYLSAIRLSRILFFEESIAVIKEFLNDPGFEYLPSAFQVACLDELAKAYIHLDQSDEAIKIINEEVLPINKNSSQVPPGWIGPTSDQSPYPYYLLSLAYLKEGERDLAIISYKKMKSINVTNLEKVDEKRYKEPPLIDELEKEISSEK